MIAARLAAITGISPTLAKGAVALFFVFLGGALMALVQDGLVSPEIAAIAVPLNALLLGLATLVDPNASHA